MTLTKRELADALGVDPALVSRDAARGMPTHSLEAARRWRDLNVRPYARAGASAARWSPDDEQAQQRLEALAVIDGGAAVRSACELGLVAADLARAGRFEAVRAPLRALLQSIPDQLRAQVQLPASVWQRLCAGLAARIAGAAPEVLAPEADYLVSVPIASDASDDFGRLVYAIAAGELVADARA